MTTPSVRADSARLAILVAAAISLAGGCYGGKEPDAGSGASAAHGAIAHGHVTPIAHPDPTVNPPSLFERAPEDEPERIASDETIARYLQTDPRTLNPLFHATREDLALIELLYDGLFKIDRDLNWQVDDNVVESWERSDDGKTYTFRLRPGLKFHDGHAWTAHDVAFTWEAIVDELVPAGTIRSGRDQLERVEALDPHTVRFVHKEALPTSEWNMVFPVLPEHILGNPHERANDPTLQKSAYYQNFAFRKPIGSGPYRLVEREPDQRLVLERWEEFHGKKPHFQRVVFKVVKDAGLALNLFKRGELDEMTLSPLQFATQTQDPEFTAVGVTCVAPTWNYYFVGWNLDGSNPFFNDRRVRVALAHAFDNRRFLEKHCYGVYEPAVGVFHRSTWMYDQNLVPIPYDRDAAARLLDEAGWELSAEDGLRYKTIGGAPRRFEFTVRFPSEADLAPKLAEALRQDLEAIGIIVRTEPMESKTLGERLREHEFEAFISGWQTGTDPDTSRNIWHSSMHPTNERPGGRNFGGFTNPRVDELYDLGARELDPAKRAAIYREMHRLIYEDQPYLFVANISTLWAFSKRLHGVDVSPRGVYGFFPGVRAWWASREDTRR